MRRDIVITTVLAGFLLGVSLASMLVAFSIVFMMMTMAVMMWLVFLWSGALKKGERRIVVLLMLISLLIGGIRFAVDYWFLPLESEGVGTVEMMGRVSALPERNGQNLDLQVTVLAVGVVGGRGQSVGDDSSDLVGKRVAVRLPAQMVIAYGDRLLLRGYLRGAGNIELNPNLRQKWFRQKLWGTLEAPQLTKRLGDGQVNLWKIIFDWRGDLLHFYSMNLSEPAASLVNGVLIGERSNIPVDLAKAFQITGLTHILAISGFNITLIINLLIVVTGGWPKPLRLTLTLLFIALFVVLTGASASVVRAAVMGVMFVLVKNMGRRVKAFKAILLSVFLIVMVEPRLLNFDISFQLSVLATLSLIFYSSALQGAAGKGIKEVLWEGVATTLAAQMITLPFIFYHFGTISLISPIANMLIGPLIPLLMLLGVVVLVVGMVLGPVVIVVAGLTQLLVSVMAVIIMTLSKIPLAQLEFGQGLWWLVLLYYLLLFILSRKYKLVPNFF